MYLQIGSSLHVDSNMYRALQSKTIYMVLSIYDHWCGTVLDFHNQSSQHHDWQLWVSFLQCILARSLCLVGNYLLLGRSGWSHDCWVVHFTQFDDLHERNYIGFNEKESHVAITFHRMQTNVSQRWHGTYFIYFRLTLLTVDKSKIFAHCSAPTYLHSGYLLEDKSKMNSSLNPWILNPPSFNWWNKLPFMIQKSRLRKRWKRCTQKSRNCTRVRSLFLTGKKSMCETD